MLEARDTQVTPTQQKSAILPSLRSVSTRLRPAAFLASVALLAFSAHSSAGTQVIGNMKAVPAAATAASVGVSRVDLELAVTLRKQGFTGKVESTLEQRLGRKVDGKMAKLGQTLFFDPIGGLHNDNSCAGCHAPGAAMGDTQSIAIGIQNNNVVGAGRTGPRNQRRTPTVINTAFYPSLMWNSRFSTPSGDPFNNSQGYAFPAPESTTRFPANDPKIKHLLIAQAHMPATELNEAAGFTGVRSGVDPRYYQFDDGKGSKVPELDATGFRNEPIRDAVVARLNANPAYVEEFAAAFPEVRGGAPISVLMVAQAIAEFEFTLVRANAPIDKFARGDLNAMPVEQKRGALLFFGKANCVACHAVSGKANEMFSDFKTYNIGVPQIAPAFGVGKGNTIFDGPGENEDFGLEQFTGNAADRYKFRSSPLRNVALQPTFFHNGAFTTLEDAINHHLNAADSAKNYNARQAGVAQDLSFILAPTQNVLATLDPRIAAAKGRLTAAEIQDLVSFVRFGLLDERAGADETCKLVPTVVPSGMPVHQFQACAVAAKKAGKQFSRR